MSPGHPLVDDRPGLPYDGDVARTTYQGLRWEFAPPFESLLAEVLQEPGRIGQDLLRNDRDPTPRRQSRILHQAVPARAARIVARGVFHSVGQEPARMDVCPGVPNDGDRRGATPGAWRTVGMVRTDGERADYRRTPRLCAVADVSRSRRRQNSNPRWGGSCDKCTTRVSSIWIFRRRTCCIRHLDNKFCLIDIDKAELHDSLDERQRIDHITVFHSRFPLTPAFYEGYGNDVARHAADIDERAAAMERARVARVSRVCLTHRHEVTTKRIGWIEVARSHQLTSTIISSASCRSLTAKPGPPMDLLSIASHFAPVKKPIAGPTARNSRANRGRVLSPRRTNAFSESISRGYFVAKTP